MWPRQAFQTIYTKDKLTKCSVDMDVCVFVCVRDDGGGQSMTIRSQIEILSGSKQVHSKRIVFGLFLLKIGKLCLSQTRRISRNRLSMVDEDNCL